MRMIMLEVSNAITWPSVIVTQIMGFPPHLAGCRSQHFFSTLFLEGGCASQNVIR